MTVGTTRSVSEELGGGVVVFLQLEADMPSVLAPAM